MISVAQPLAAGVFGAQQPTQATGLFGNSTGFNTGAAATGGAGLFGSGSTSTASGIFGANAAATATPQSSLFAKPLGMRAFLC